jgi:lipopolysaccharide/colanic/teichoic acid biosynthesis glycosyltransferase
MRVPFPTSRAAFRFRFRPFDVALAIVSPVLALYLSNALVLGSTFKAEDVSIYCLTSIISSLLAFLAFRIDDGLLHHFAVHDALKVSKAVITSEVATCVVVFILTRLDDIPRSVPIMHVFLLLASLLLSRILMSFASSRMDASRTNGTAAEYVILVSSTSLSALYIDLLNASNRGNRRVVSVLDNRPRMVGRAIGEVPIVGTPDHLEAVIEEYRVHGIQIDRVVFAEDSGVLPEEQVKRAMFVCEREQICLDFLPQLVSLQASRAKVPIVLSVAPDFVLSPYFRWKQLIDVVVAAVLIVVLLPLFVGTALIVLFDVGFPVFFWQRRLGARGRWFLLYKFRTLSAPVNRLGALVSHGQRLSRIGQLLRDTSLDELPQIFNVLVGDMSLIGPRPLLPRDQPKDASIRLMVQPGITGWAQVNGRKSLTPEEKEQLDAWYVRNCSLAVDARIVWRTFRLLLNGPKGSTGDSVAESLPSADLRTWEKIGEGGKIEQV